MASDRLYRAAVRRMKAEQDRRAADRFTQRWLAAINADRSPWIIGALSDEELRARRLRPYADLVRDVLADENLELDIRRPRNGQP